MSMFRHSRELPATTESVFAAIQNPARLARWWGPDGFTNTFHTFEFRQGGSWQFTMHGPDGADYPNQSEFLEIVPNSVVRIKHINLPHFELSISLEPSATGTFVSWVGVFENHEFAENRRQFLEAANEQNLDRLALEVSTGTQRGANLQMEPTRQGIRAIMSPRRAAHLNRLAEWKPEMVTIKYDDLSAAFDFVSFAAPMEHRAYVSLDTGATYWISETNPIEEEDLPDDLDTSDRYIAVPHKNELDLGNNLALRFVETQLPDRYADVEDFFRRRGAYARFKELLAAEGCLEKWYAFEAESTERALRDWCKANEIHLAENGSQSA